ncbi:hypothetical protein JTE90_021651 [Oedothorax gibbosus]|uniref:Uncharacterized protein n=1 Tax=Oedothorax gibbosus TaxID=931172 RepID=A0AAV6VQJ9_9ARAC|nr:hypothetical protein JTE90_021651 [Oedothorax gibbosus]
MQTTPWDINADLSPKSLQTTVKDTSPAPPPNAWEKPINHSLRSHSPVVTSQAITNISVSTSITTTEVQSLAVAFKSSSFDRSDQHDSGIDVSDQPASAASSQRSSPSNDCKIMTPINSGKSSMATEVVDLVTEIDTCKPMCTVVFENKNFKAENAVLDKFGGQAKNQSAKETSTSCENLSPGNSTTKPKDPAPEAEDKSHCLPVSFPSKDSFGKSEENSDMKLDFNFESGLERLTEEKNARNANSSNHLPNKSINIARSMEVSNNGSPVGVASLISPSTDELNLKIQSVKKVWENDPPLPTVMEHPRTVSEENSNYNVFTNTSESSTNVYNSTADSTSQNRKEADGSDMTICHLVSRKGPIDVSKNLSSQAEGEVAVVEAASTLVLAVN